MMDKKDYAFGIAGVMVVVGWFLPNINSEMFLAVMLIIHAMEG